MNRINLICLGVSDLAAARKFFLGLGFEEPNDAMADQIVFFNNAGTKLELFPYAELVKDIGLDASENPKPVTFNGMTHAYNTKSIEEVDAIFAKVEGLGGKIIKQPVKADWGGYSGYFTDPDGYYWEVAYADSWQFDDNEMLIIA